MKNVEYNIVDNKIELTCNLDNDYELSLTIYNNEDYFVCDFTIHDISDINDVLVTGENISLEEFGKKANIKFPDYKFRLVNRNNQTIELFNYMVESNYTHKTIILATETGFDSVFIIDIEYAEFVEDSCDMA